MIIDRTPITPHDPMTLHCGLCGRPARVCTCPPCGGCERAVWACECEVEDWNPVPPNRSFTVQVRYEFQGPGEPPPVSLQPTSVHERAQSEETQVGKAPSV